jgi:hypothetical protein
MGSTYHNGGAIAEEHLPYEIGMLVFSALVFQTMGKGGPHPDIEAALQNALITAFYIHARNLIDFLQNKRKSARVRKMALDYKPFTNGNIDKQVGARRGILKGAAARPFRV